MGEAGPAPATAGLKRRDSCSVSTLADVGLASGDVMKLLLTESGVRNASILAVLVDLLGKSIAEASALCIPTAGYGGPYGDPSGPWRFVSGQSPSPMTELGWKSLGVLELTALPIPSCLAGPGAADQTDPAKPANAKAGQARVSGASVTGRTVPHRVGLA
jgi:hypothetical protein